MGLTNDNTAKLWPGIAGVLLVGFFVESTEVRADIYSFVDSRGVVHLTDRPLDARYRLLIRTNPERYVAAPRTTLRSEVPYSRAMYDSSRQYGFYSGIIHEAARQHGLNSALLKAMIQVESSFNPLAVSPKGAVGLMQLMPETAKRYGVRNRLDPRANVNAGAEFLRDLLIRYRNDLRLSLAAYNAGEGAVKKYGNQIPPYPETQRYVTLVLEYYQQYRRAM